jgi:hypothetical protein
VCRLSSPPLISQHRTASRRYTSQSWCVRALNAAIELQCNRAANEKREAQTETSVCVCACCGQVDVYPTVAALAGLPPPPDIVGRPLNQVGTSLEPVFLDPAVKPGSVKDYAFSEFPQCPGIHPVPGRSAAVPPLLSSPHLTCRRISDSAVSACHAHVCLCSPLCEDKSGQYSRVSLTLTSNLSVRVCDRVAAVVCVCPTYTCRRCGRWRRG